MHHQFISSWKARVSLQSVAEYNFDQHSTLEDLVARAGHLKYEQQQAVEARRSAVSRKMEEANDAVGSCDRQLKEYVSYQLVYSFCSQR